MGRSNWFRWLKEQDKDTHQRLIWIGGVYTVTFGALAYLSVINAAQVAVLTYESVVSGHYPISLFGYFAILLIIMAILWVVEWKIMLPAKWKFQNQQQAIHDYPVMVELGKIKEQLAAIQKELTELKH